MSEYTEEIDRSNMPYRKCVGIMLLNNDGKVFVGQRLDNIAEAWQMPQGGVENGENLEDAAKRELKEEIGTDSIEFVCSTENWLSYDIPDSLIPRIWGGKYRGQTQMWFLAKFLGRDEEINIATEDPEFREWQWVEPEKLPSLIVPFKLELYKKLLEEFSEHLK
jgi:putative (di)nucleoside polyphosphate hydrolase